jgi:hypothetical protein
VALMQMYVEGVSRKVTEITEELCGAAFSKKYSGLDPRKANFNH